jgi:integrase
MKRTKRRSRGTGSIYKPAGSQNWSIKFVAQGRRIFEPTGTSDWSKAQQLLTQRLHELDTGKFIGPEIRRGTVSDLAEDFLRDYRIHDRKSLSHAERRWRLHLKPFFGGVRVGEITSTFVGKYVDQRLTAGASNASINRELAALKRMFHLAAKATPPKVTWLPAFPHLKENNVRKGFVDDKQFEALAASAGELWLRAFLEVAYTYAWRKAELMGLRVRQVDVAGKTLRLDVGATKNDDGREVRLSPTACTLLEKCIQGKTQEDHVFTREGKPVKDFRGTWAKLCVAVGLGQMFCRACEKPVTGEKCECGSRGRELKYSGLIVHDLRRSAARSSLNAGVREKTIMRMGGWRTRSVFDRYSIVDQTDIDDAIVKVQKQRKRNLAMKPQKADIAICDKVKSQLSHSPAFFGAADNDIKIVSDSNIN